MIEAFPEKHSLRAPSSSCGADSPGFEDCIALPHQRKSGDPSHVRPARDPIIPAQRPSDSPTIHTATPEPGFLQQPLSPMRRRPAFGPLSSPFPPPHCRYGAKVFPTSTSETVEFDFRSRRHDQSASRPSRSSANERWVSWIGGRQQVKGPVALKFHASHLLRRVAAGAIKEKRKLRRQPSNICSVYELVEARGKFFLALEFGEGAQWQEKLCPFDSSRFGV